VHVVSAAGWIFTAGMSMQVSPTLTGALASPGSADRIW
jgi:hypothetical protein